MGLDVATLRPLWQGVRAQYVFIVILKVRFTNGSTNPYQRNYQCIEGFSFNLIESCGDFSIELVGTASFDEDDQDWACDEIFEPNRRAISIPEKYSGLQWEICLDNMQTLLIDYMKSNEKGALVLQRAEGIGIGFVDGDLIVVKKP